MQGQAEHAEHQHGPTMLAWVLMLVLTLGATFGFPVEVSISSAPCNQTTESIDKHA